MELRKFDFNEYLEDIKRIYKSANWLAYLKDDEKLNRAFKNSIYLLGAFEHNELIGFVRCLGDGEHIVIVQDLIVDSDYYRQRIGTNLFKAVSEKNGLNSKGDISIEGGETFVESSNNENSAIRYEGNAKITGGTFVGIGGDSKIKSFGDLSTQGSVLLYFPESTKENLKLIDDFGRTLIEYKPTSEYKSVILSTKDFRLNKRYKLVAGDQTLDVFLDKLNYKSAKVNEK